VLEVLYHHAKFGGARISPAAGVAKNVEIFYWQYCAKHNSLVSTRRWYLIYSEADFAVFRSTGATCCTDGVKFGTVPSVLNFTPIGAMVRV